MTRKRSQWWTDLPTLRKRLRCYNAQGAKYHYNPIPLADLQSHIGKQSEKVLSYCCWCFRPLTKANVSFDHALALVSGGKHSLLNWSAACKLCNKRKLDADPDFWRDFVLFLQSKVAIQSKAVSGLHWFNTRNKVNWRRRRG